MEETPSQKEKFGRWVWVVVIVLVAAGIGVATRRELYLTGLVTPVVNPRFGPFDVNINQQTLLTWLHIVPGTLYLVLAALQFVRRIRVNYPKVHRWCGRVAVAMGVIIGLTALLMSVLTPIGGFNETAATMLFALLFLLCLLKGFFHIRRGEIPRHREWMIRAFAIGLAIATVRPIVALFFVFSTLQPREFFGTAFWIGFTIHLIAAEAWIHYTRPHLKLEEIKMGQP